MAAATGEEGEGREVTLNDDVLDEIISRVLPFDLVAASSVSMSWRRAVFSSPRRRIPWLIIHLRGSTILGYDPHSRGWIKIKVPNTTSRTSTLRSYTHPCRLLHAFSHSSLAFSTDPFGAVWRHVPPSPISGKETIVVLVGAHLVVICTTSTYCQVYNLHATSGRWKTCEPVPDAAPQFYSNISVATTDREVYLLSKSSGNFCAFYPAARRWGCVSRIHPEPVYSIGIGMAGGRLINVVVADLFRNIKLWEVVLNEMGGVRDVREIGRMPTGMVERMMIGDLAPLSLEFSTAGDFGYICNSMDPESEVILVEFFRDGGCRWESVASPTAGVGKKELNPGYKMAFQCSAVGLDDLRRVGPAVGFDDKPVHRNNCFGSLLRRLGWITTN